MTGVGPMALAAMDGSAHPSEWVGLHLVMRVSP